MPLQTFQVQGRQVRLHPECVDGFKADRALGLTYGPYLVLDPVTRKLRFAMHAEEASMINEFCPYCLKEE